MYFEDKNDIDGLSNKLKNNLGYWDDLNKSIIDFTQNLGQGFDLMQKSGSYSQVLNKNFALSAKKLEIMGVSTKEVSQFLTKMASDSGTMVGFSEKAIVKFGALQKLLGQDNVSMLSQGFNSIGVGLTTSMEMIDDIRKSSIEMGLDANKVASVMSQNFKTASAYNFKGGSKGISEMAQQSIILGQNMTETLELAKKLRKPEQAIEFAQQMQAVGGAFADLLGDATTNLYNARKNPKQLAEDMSKASASLITFNEVTGELEADYDRAALASEFMEKTTEQLIEEGKKAKKLEILKNMFGEIPEDKLNVLSGFADFKGGKISLQGLENLDPQALKEIGIQSADQLQDISQLTSKEMGNLVEVLKKGVGGKDSDIKKSAEDQVNASQRLVDVLDNLTNIMKASITSYNDLSKSINDTQKNVALSSFQNKGFDEIVKGMSEKATKEIGDLIKAITGDIQDFLNALAKYPISGDKKKNEGGNTTPTKSKNKKGGAKCDPCNSGDPDCKSYELEDGSFGYCKTKRSGGILKSGSIVSKKEHFGNGGVFKGPSHEDGGIPILNKSTGKMLEVEGGEAIINKNSTEMFKPILSKINEVGGGVKFADGGITPVDLENIISKMGNSVNTSINTNSSMDVNVNINGSVSIDGKDFKIPEDQKEKLSKSIINKAVEEVNNKINNNAVTLGRRNKPVFPFDTN